MMVDDVAAEVDQFINSDQEPPSAQMRRRRGDDAFNERRPKVFAFHALLPFTIIMRPNARGRLRFT